MHPLEIRRAQREFPFVPFRIHLTNGKTFDIPHPDFVTVTKSAIYVAVDPAGKDEIPSHMVKVSALHITHVEPLELHDASSAGASG